MLFRGGTYISQVYAERLLDAVKLWGEKLEPDDIKHLSKKGKSELLTELIDIELVNITGMKNVWFFCFSIKKGFLAVNVIKTSNIDKMESLK